MDLYNKLLSQKQKITELSKNLEQAKQDYLTIQIKYGEIYKANLVRKYMHLWNNSGIFPADDELTNVIFFLGGIKLNPKTNQPKIALKFDSHKCKFHFFYFNVRLETWLEIK